MVQQQFSNEPQELTAQDIIAWAWEHSIPEVPFERSFDLTGPIYDALEARGIIPQHGIFVVSEQVVSDVLQEIKHAAFQVIAGGMTREQKARLDKDYWKSVEADEQRYQEELDDRDIELDSYPDESFDF